MAPVLRTLGSSVPFRNYVRQELFSVSSCLSLCSFEFVCCELHDTVATRSLLYCTRLFRAAIAIRVWAHEGVAAGAVPVGSRKVKPYVGCRDGCGVRASETVG